MTNSVEPDGHPYRLLEYLYHRPKEWVKPSEVYGKIEGFPTSANYVPASLARKGLVEKVVESNRSRVRITPQGIRAYENAQPKTNKIRELREKNAPPRPVDSSIKANDLYQIRSKLGEGERHALEGLLLEQAFDTKSACTSVQLEECANIQPDMIDEALDALITNQLVIKTINGGYYLTFNGITIAESLALKGVEFGDDSIAALLLNPLGRKAIHVIQVGKTALQLAEEVGYLCEEPFITNQASFKKEAEYVTYKLFQFLDRLAQFGVIGIRYHPTIEGSTKVVRIIQPSVLEVLRAIAILVEFIPTLFLEDNKDRSFLREILPLTWIKQCTAQFDAVDVIPAIFRGRVASAERVAYWLPAIEALEEAAQQWKGINLKENGGRHYFMRDVKVGRAKGFEARICYDDKCEHYDHITRLCGRTDGKCPKKSESFPRGSTDVQKGSRGR